VSSVIKAAVLVGPGSALEIREILLDEPLPGEVQVHVERVGLCHSDLHYVKGALSIDTPAILGHEVVGTVAHVGQGVSRIGIGDRVVATVTPSCGVCTCCLQGRPTQCQHVDQLRHRPRPKHTTPNGAPVTSLGGIGAFAEAILVSEASLAPVPDDMPLEVACLLGCCVTTGVGAVVHGARVGPQDTVAVIGCGGVGIAAIQGARLVGARRVVADDTTQEKLELAKRFGATDTVLARSPSQTPDDIRALVPGGVTHAFEAVGRPETAQAAFRCLGPMGTATILGLMAEGTQLSIPADDLVYGDRAIKGAYMGANRFLSDVDIFVDHYRNNRLDLDSMVTGIIGFADINHGLTAMADPTTIRVVLDMTSEAAV
jgi:alcohol dehydrogenase/S-(hydroxymethyl)glutathione dehydrogenase/alcohol dehydrogenase